LYLAPVQKQKGGHEARPYITWPAISGRRKRAIANRKSSIDNRQ
jgi:hypothetical protein